MVDKEWVDWYGVVRGEQECPMGTLVVVHSPSWKEWQQLLSEPSTSFDQKMNEVMTDHMFNMMSSFQTETNDPCLGDPDKQTWEVELTKVMAKLTEISWESGHRMANRAVKQAD